MTKDKMKILVIGLDGADSKILFNDERLSNFRRLMEFGCYGKLEGVDIPAYVPAWLFMATSKIPETTEENDRDQTLLESVRGEAIWNQVEMQGKHGVVIIIPPGDYYPPQLALQLGGYIKEDDVPIASIDQGKKRIHDNSLRLFAQVRQQIQDEKWDYFHYVDFGLLQLDSWNRSRDIYESLIRDYYLHLDEQVGMILELLTDDTVVFVMSNPGVNGQESSFILISANNPLQGEVKGATLIDIAPTLLELAGYKIPDSMQGRSLITDMNLDTSVKSGLSEEEEAILHERLSGLGYF